MSDLPPNYPNPHDKKISELPPGNVTLDCLVPLVGVESGNLTTIQGTLAQVSSLAPVQSVHARTGDVVGMAGDYNATLVGFETAGRSIIQPASTDVQSAVNDLDDEVGRLSLTQQMAGAYDALNNVMEHVTSAGANAGFVVGQDLPTPAAGIEAYYVVVSVEGSYNGTPMFVTDRLWCDGVQWIPIAGPRASTPVTSVHGRIGDIVGVSGDYNAPLIPYTGTAIGDNVAAALDGLAARVAALEARPYIRGVYYRYQETDQVAWVPSGGTTGNQAQFARHAVDKTRTWGDHGVVVSGQDVNLDLAGRYLIQAQMVVANNSSNYMLEVGGWYSSIMWQSSFQTDSIITWCGFYNATSAASRAIRINKHGGGSWDYKTYSICITRFA